MCVCVCERVCVCVCFVHTGVCTLCVGGCICVYGGKGTGGDSCMDCCCGYGVTLLARKKKKKKKKKGVSLSSVFSLGLPDYRRS